jgi:hypothetical protein
MADLYQYLPGFNITYKDGGLVVPRPIVTTDSVLIIGTATDGPKGEPVSVTRPEDSELLFGKPYNLMTNASNGTTLMLGLRETYNAGCRDIRLLRIGGVVASADVVDGSSASKMVLQGKYPGALYNNTKYTVKLDAPSSFILTKPLEKKGTTITIPLGDKATINVVDDAETAAIKLEASDYGIAGNSVAYRVDLTDGAEKFIIREDDTSQPIEIDIKSDTLTIAQLVTAINDNANLDFIVASDLTADGTAVANATLAAQTAWKYLSGGANALTVAELAKALNNNSDNDAVVAEAVAGAEDDVAKDTLAAVVNVSLSGGSDGTNLTAAEMYHELYHAYQLIEDYVVDCIVVLGVYADTDITQGTVITNFAEQLANHCSILTERSAETYGVISCSPVATVSQATIRAKVQSLLGRTNTYKKYNVVHTHDDESTGTGTFTLTEVKNIYTGVAESVGHLISVVAMPEIQLSHPVIGRYYAPVAASYAGFVSTLRPESAPTNKILPNALALRYKLSPAQLNSLAQARYVTLKERSGGAAVTDGCTAATVGSDYARLSTVRITFAAVSIVREAAEPFIGEPNELPQKNALDTAIKSGLEKMKAAGAITNYRFGITSTLEQKILGESYIDLEIVPAMERRKIKVTVSLRATL